MQKASGKRGLWHNAKGLDDAITLEQPAKWCPGIDSNIPAELLALQPLDHLDA